MRDHCRGTRTSTRALPFLPIIQVQGYSQLNLRVHKNLPPVIVMLTDAPERHLVLERPSRIQTVIRIDPFLTPPESLRKKHDMNDSVAMRRVSPPPRVCSTFRLIVLPFIAAGSQCRSLFLLSLRCRQMFPAGDASLPAPDRLLAPYFLARVAG